MRANPLRLVAMKLAPCYVEGSQSGKRNVGRIIVVYFDGTRQDGGVKPDQRLSNDCKLYRGSQIGPDSPIADSEACRPRVPR